MGLIISIIGLILLFLAVKSISNYYSNQTPFKYMLYSLISGIILAIVAGISLFLLLIPIFNSASSTSSTSTFYVSLISIFLLIVVLVLVPSFVSIIFQYLAYDSVGKLTGIHEFHTAALLLLIGIILTIIVIGIILIFIGIIFLIIAFAKLPGEAKPALNDQTFNQDTNKEIF
ncbi:DUF996 domain-containing protein [Ferroplasma acidarmanus]|nr:DUF996 domain-containing protein [Ferroplasma acidarmanus]